MLGIFFPVNLSVTLTVLMPERQRRKGADREEGAGCFILNAADCAVAAQRTSEKQNKQNTNNCILSLLFSIT